MLIAWYLLPESAWINLSEFGCAYIAGAMTSRCLHIHPGYILLGTWSVIGGLVGGLLVLSFKRLPADDPKNTDG
jgi:hypothetical protein